MIAGIDLSGSPKKISGLCIMGTTTKTFSVYRDEEILEIIEREKPEIIAIDAPLSFRGTAYRDGDREIRKFYKILPLTFFGMKKLTERGIELKKRLGGYRVIEVYPHASKEVLGIKNPRDLEKFGVSVDIKNEHEFDAVICALTGRFYFQGMYKKFGDEDPIILPNPK
ncbi:MAG: DUF429 domain-containing protein [Candidatus Syntropharchaeia archaeon]